MTEETTPHKKIRKRFFSSRKECAWLNACGSKGLLLLYRTEDSYTFEQTSDCWFYSMEWLDCSPESQQGEEIIASRIEDGCTLAATYSLWAYFVSSAAIQTPAQAKKRTALRYRNTAFLLYAADAVAAVLIAYHLAIRAFLETQQVYMTAPTMEPASNLIVTIARRLVYGGELILYRYSKFCSGIFGDTKATYALSVLVPLAILLTVLGSFWLYEWRMHLPIKTMKEELDNDEVAQASGETADNC